MHSSTSEEEKLKFLFHYAELVAGPGGREGGNIYHFSTEDQACYPEGYHTHDFGKRNGMHFTSFILRTDKKAILGY